MTVASTCSGRVVATTLPSPSEPLSVVVRLCHGQAAVVIGAGFADVSTMLDRLPSAIGDAVRVVAPEFGDLTPVTAAVAAWSGGDLEALDAVVVEQPGGVFMQQVWNVMRTIPAGQVWTYGQVAAAASRPAAVRAVGQACARNLVAPFVPCHRVLRRDGTLGGYYYGLGVKSALLAHEGAQGVL